MSATPGESCGGWSGILAFGSEASSELPVAASVAVEIAAGAFVAVAGVVLSPRHIGKAASANPSVAPHKPL